MTTLQNVSVAVADELESLTRDIDDTINKQFEIDGAYLRYSQDRARPSDWELLQAADSGSSQRRLEQVNRVKAIAKFQSLAGSPDQYDAALAKATEAHGRLQAIEAELNPEIQKLQRQIDGMKGQIKAAAEKSEAAAAVVKDMDAAQDKLRGLVPDNIKAAIHRLRRTVASTVMPLKELNELRSLAHQCDHWRDGEAGRLKFQSACKAYEAQGESGFEHRRPHPRDLLEASNDALDRLQAVERQIDGAMEEFQHLQDMYVPVK